MSSITIVCDAPSCGVTYDDSGGVFYDRNMFIEQATGQTQNRRRLSFNRIEINKVIISSNNQTFFAFSPLDGLASIV